MLLDQGSDINSIYRTPRNVVMTPLDCALQKGFRSTAKFLQLHGGLPASKLRLSGRSPNAINDQELVKPLHAISKSKSDSKIQSVDCLKTSDGAEHKCQEQRCEYNINERCRRRLPRLKCCIHIRASSCETHAKGNESSDINRSKSNIELHRSRKIHHFKKHPQRSESTISYSSSSSSSSECINCKVKRKDRSTKSRRSRAKSTPRKNVDMMKSRPSKPNQSSSEEEWKRKSVTRTHYQKRTSKTTTKISKNQAPVQDFKPDEVDHPSEISQNQSNVDELANQSEEMRKSPLATAKDDDEKLETNMDSLAADQPNDGVLSSNIIHATADVHAANDDNLTNVEVSDKIDVLTESTHKVESRTEHAGEPSITDQAQSHEEAKAIDESNSEHLNLSTNDDMLMSQNSIDPVMNLADKSESQTHNIDSNEGNTAVSTIAQVGIPETNVEPQTNNEATVSDSPPTDTPQIIESLPSESAGGAETRTHSDTEEVMNRKSSFTVLASDESVDHHDLDLNSAFQNESIDEGPSFEVLESNNFNVADENTSDDDDENQLTVSADEDELSGEHFGVQKLARNRAQSTIVRRSVDHVGRDQDSGFEPSPRTLQTKIPSPQIMSAVVKSRRSVIGGRSRTNTVDMTAVEKRLNMNTRR